MHDATISRLELFTNSQQLWDFRQIGCFATITMQRSRRENDGDEEKENVIATAN